MRNIHQHFNRNTIYFLAGVVIIILLTVSSGYIKECKKTEVVKFYSFIFHILLLIVSLKNAHILT